MKKSLLLIATAAMALSVNAQNANEPQVLDNLAITNVSPNGRYAISQDFYNYSVSFIDLQSGDSETLAPPEDDWSLVYSAPTGNAVSDNGIFLFADSYAGTAKYFYNGQEYELSYGPATGGYANAITPDGSRICGSIGISMTTDAKEVMQRPAVWNRNDDGTYSEPVELPYPTVDWAGALPQYVQPHWISADGKTLAGMVHDGYGDIDQPIVWREDAEGNWAYEFIHPELFKPEGIEFPEYPGDDCGLETPQKYDFMTEEELAAYAAAEEDAWETGEWPDYEDFMTDEEIAAYNAAAAAYNAVYEPWAEKFDAWMEVYTAAQALVPNFIMNCDAMSEDGGYFASTSATEDTEAERDPFSWFTPMIYLNYIFDLNSGEMRIVPNKDKANAFVIQVFDDGTALATTSSDGSQGNIYYLAAGAEHFVPFYEWVKDVNSDLYAWMEENMKHEITIEEYNPETDDVDVSVANEWITGSAIADKGMRNLYAWTMNVWDPYNEEQYCFSYILPIGDLSGVGSIGANDTDAPVEYFNIKGIRVNNPEAGQILIRRQGKNATTIVK